MISRTSRPDRPPPLPVFCSGIMSAWLLPRRLNLCLFVCLLDLLTFFIGAIHHTMLACEAWKEAGLSQRFHRPIVFPPPANKHADDDDWYECILIWRPLQGDVCMSTLHRKWPTPRDGPEQRPGWWIRTIAVRMQYYGVSQFYDNLLCDYAGDWSSDCFSFMLNVQLKTNHQWPYAVGNEIHSPCSGDDYLSKWGCHFIFLPTWGLWQDEDIRPVIGFELLEFV